MQDFTKGLNADVGRTILIATDYTSSSARAMDWSAKNLLQDGDEVYLVHAVNEEYSVATDLEFGELSVVMAEQDMRDKLFEQAKKNAEKWKNSFLDQSLKKVKVTTVVEFGSPGPLIVSKAQILNSTMIVVGSHGKGTLSEIFLGSVSAYCLHHAKRPVIVVN
ncbi:hypothetical protein HK096_001169 [Nowakowskiella sp. JEL0078]|nr:hypothetical protein HK096_001169 [Nowakowskiella sp. JEL0078]